MKRILIQLARYIYHFGPIQGLVILTQTKLGGDLRIKVPGIPHRIFLRRQSSDLSGFRQLFMGTDMAFLNRLKEPKWIVDGGANIGLSAIQFKHKFRDAQVIAIEPDPDNVDILKRNLAPYSNIHYEQAGLWDKNSNLSISDPRNLGKWAMVVNEDPTGPVRGISIDYLLDKYGIEYIDLLKLDIETSEKVLFENHYSSWLPRVRMIMIELHDRYLPGCARSFFTAINHSLNNYEYFTVGEYTIIVNLDLAV